MIFDFLTHNNPRANLTRKIKMVSRLFHVLDREIAQFQKQTGLQCRSYCGHCCECPEITTSTLELLPLAVYLLKNKEAETWLARCEQVHRKGPCVFYRPAPLNSGLGNCLIYPFRPLICRLFGFAVVSNKQDFPVVVTCLPIKTDLPANVRQAQENLLAGLKAPNMNNYARRLYSVDPVLGIEQISINAAVFQAIQKAGIILQQYYGERFA